MKIKRYFFGVQNAAFIAINILLAVASTRADAAPSSAVSQSLKSGTIMKSEPKKAANSISAKPLNARDFGARGDGSDDDALAIMRALEAAQKPGVTRLVLLPRGTYRLSPMSDAAGHVNFSNVKNLTIRGEKNADGTPATRLLTTDWFHSGLELRECENLTIENLAIDWETPPSTQGTLMRVLADDNSIEWKIDDGFPEPTDATVKFAQFYDASTRRLNSNFVDIWFSGFEKIGDRLYRAKVSNFAQIRDAPAGLKIGARMSNLGAPGVAFWGSRDCVLRNVAIHSSPGLAHVLNGSDNIAIIGGRIGAPAGSNRLLSSNADGVHCVNNRRGPRIENCVFEGMNDDAVNIHAQALPLFSADGKNLTCLYEARFYANFRAGDRIAILDISTGAVKGRAKIVTAKTAREGALDVWEIELDAALSNLKTTAAGTYKIAGEIAGDASTRAAPYDVLINEDLQSAGFVIRGNTFRDHRGRGMLLRGGPGLIENNTLQRNLAAGIAVGAELDWNEGGGGHNLTIRNNRFLETNRTPEWGYRAAIHIADHRRGREELSARLSHDIEISGNTFENCGQAAIYLSTVTNVRVLANTISHPCAAATWRDLVPFPQTPRAAILINNAGSVTLRNNVLRDAGALPLSDDLAAAAKDDPARK